MAKTTVILIVALALLHHAAIDGFTTRVETHVWTSDGCGGNNDVYPSERLCWNYPNYHESIRAVSMDSGSCFKIFKQLGCTGESMTIKYPNKDACTLSDDWHWNVYSSTDCNSHSASVRCPSGTYIRDIQYGDANQGMTIRCFNPTLNTPSYTKNTNDITISNPTTKSCPVASSGIRMTSDDEWKMYHEPLIQCGRSTSHNLDIVKHSNLTNNENELSVNAVETKSCPTNGIQAMTGVDVTIDEAGVIKTFEVVCSTVPDPATLCEPSESIRTVVQCDNTGSDNELECSYVHTVGVGFSKTMSATERKESEFYQEFGFEIGVSTPFLSASMSATLGNSELVGYEWSESDESTWTEETTVSATIKVRPRSHSKLEQLVGKCSFFGTSVNYFRQTDVSATGVTTVTYFNK